MESGEDVEIVKLLHEKWKRETAGDSKDNDDHLMLSTLFSKMESPLPNPSKRTDEKAKEEAEHSPDSLPSKGKRERHLEECVEEIAKDIKKMKRQNNITQVLLSAMIFLTLTWELSEFSMIMMVKNRLCHPLRFIGGMLWGMFKGKRRQIQNQLHEASTSNDEDNHNNGAHLQMPEVLREFGFSENKE